MSNAQGMEWTGETQVAQRWCDNVEVVPAATKHTEGHVVKIHYDDFIAASSQQGLSSLISSLENNFPHGSAGKNCHKLQPGHRQALRQEGAVR